MRHLRGLGALSVMAIVAGLAIVAMIVVAVLSTRRSAFEGTVALQQQVRLARAEGLPTTWQEYAVSIKSARPSENAAPYYLRLSKLKITNGTELTRLTRDLPPLPGADWAKRAEVLLRKNASALDLIDRATKRPRCWFNRDWSLGPAVLMPELATMKSGVRLLLLRALVADNEGLRSEVAANLNEAVVVAQHAGEEGSTLSCLVEDAIYVLVVRAVAMLEFNHPKDQQYRKVASRLISTWPKFDPKFMHREELFFILTLVDFSLTDNGLRKLGLRDEDVPMPLRLMRSRGDQSLARAKVIEAERTIWESYGEPLNVRHPKMEQAKRDLGKALAAFPIASDIYYKLNGDNGQVDSGQEQLEAGRLQYVAMFRALAHGRPPKWLDLSDLRSPFDNKPLSYSFDGQQIAITVSTPGENVARKPLKVPTDVALGRATAD